MPKNDLTFTIGGEAGQGLESSSAGFAHALAHGGLHIFTLMDYRSRIRGGHNFAQIRVHSEPIYSHRDDIHLLLALSEESIRRHLDELVAGGGIVFDADMPVAEDLKSQMEASPVQPFAMPLKRMATELGGSAVMMNTAAMAAAAGVMSYPLSYIEAIIRQNFKKKGAEVTDANLKVADAAYTFAVKEYAPRFEHKLEPIAGAPPRMLLNGNEAFGFGALAGGCRFVSGYPMTPGSPVLEWLAGRADKHGIVVKHTEDEVAAICMAIGAGHVGARALTPTSGGGFSLMVEALGFAGMSETPVVIYEAQRPGPSTGLPTRHEQSDLLFALHASQGEFPRIVLTPGTVEESFEAGWRAFNFADKYQTPVIVLSDHFLATSSRTVDLDAFDLDQVQIERGKLLTPAELDQWAGEYLRYENAADGVSPRALPGHPKAVYVAEGNDHDSDSGINEEIGPRVAQMDKRMKKLETARAEMRPPARFGPADAPVLLIGWGSTVGPAREALKMLNARKPVAQYVHISDIWPFPADAVGEILAGAKLAICVEQNATGQLAKLIQQETGFSMDNLLLKYDGRAFSADYVADGVQEVTADA
jgi:2-oxoglutarate ferredoxin oxidoreductase subunit alpha